MSKIESKYKAADEEKKRQLFAQLTELTQLIATQKEELEFIFGA